MFRSVLPHRGQLRTTKPQLPSVAQKFLPAESLAESGPIWPLAPTKKPLQDTPREKDLQLPLPSAPFIAGTVLAGTEPPGRRIIRNRPVKLQVAFAPGGSADVIARIIGQKLSERWKQSVVVENRGGAGGNIAGSLGREDGPTGATFW